MLASNSHSAPPEGASFHTDADTDTTASKRQFHNKVRTGCDTCKKRRVKCDEAKPSCLRCRASGKQCLGYPWVSAAKHFEPSQPTSACGGRRRPSESDDNDNDNRDSSRTSRSASTPEPLLSLQRREPCYPSFADIAAAPSILAFSSSNFDSANEKYSHDFFRHWLCAYTAPRAETVPDLWTVHYPKVAEAIPALKDAMFANGIIGTTLLRKGTAAQYDVARLTALQHTNSAIAYLVKHPQPPNVVVMVAWLFWLLDMAQGHFASSTMHVESALKMAADLHPNSAEEEAVLQLLRDVANTREHVAALTRRYPLMLSRDTPRRTRMAASLPLLRRAGERVVLAQLKLAFSADDGDGGTGPLAANDKAVLLRSLRRLRREIEWLVRRWSERLGDRGKEEERAVLEEISAVEAEAGEGAGQPGPELLSPHLEEIALGIHSVELLCVIFARTIAVYVSRVAHDDLEMRQDLVELLQILSIAAEDE